MFTPTVALWATDLGRPLASLEAWLEEVAARLEQAREAGVDMILMPEYACARWLHYASPDLAGPEQVPWLAEQAVLAHQELRSLVEACGVGLIPGSWPVAVDSATGLAFVNRAPLLFPDAEYFHDKVCLTPDECDTEGWNLIPGSRVRLMHWRGLRIALLICLDVELPAVAARLAAYQPDLLLVPSMTQRLAGYHRVFNCAKARAVELQTAVCAVGCMGAPPQWMPLAGGAGAYLPCEETLDHHGVWVHQEAATVAPEDEPLLIARDLPVGLLRELRAGRAEVWPGAWKADHLIFEEV